MKIPKIDKKETTMSAIVEVKCTCSEGDMETIAAAISDQLKYKAKVRPNHLIEVYDADPSKVRELLAHLARYVYIVVDSRVSAKKD